MSKLPNKVHTKEHEDMRNLFNIGKKQFQDFTKNIIIKVVNLETSTAKFKLAKELLKI